jgi:hypothetical protein
MPRVLDPERSLMMVSVLHHGVNVGVKAVDPRAAQDTARP